MANYQRATVTLNAPAPVHPDPIPVTTGNDDGVVWTMSNTTHVFTGVTFDSHADIVMRRCWLTIQARRDLAASLRHIGVLAFIAGLSLLYIPESKAQIIEEILVIAQKREHRAQDVGISMTVFTADQLRTLNILSSETVANHTPGLQATSFSGDPTVMLFAIRGVGQNDFADHHEGPTALYVDGAYVSTLGALGFHLFDLERVEVLRGPQGTLFGRNATGGLVHYVSARPTKDFEAFIDVLAAEEGERRLEGALSGPLSDRLRARLSVAAHERDGYRNNRVGPDVHEIDNTSGRLQITFDVTPELQALLKLHGAKDDNAKSGGFEQRASVPGVDGLGEFLPPDVNADLFGLGSCPGCDPLGYRDLDGDVWAGEYDTPDDLDREVYGGSLTLNWVHDGMTLTSITDAFDLDKDYGEDSDGSPNPLLVFKSSQDTQQFSQELRLSGLGDNLTWTAGLYYLAIDGDYSTLLDSPVFLAAQTNTYDLETRSWAVFGELEYELSDTWRVIGGFRWTEDEKDYNFQPTCVGVGCLGFFVFPGLGAVNDIGGYRAKDDDGDYAAKGQLEWRPTSDMMVYAGASRGYKAGGFNAPIDGLLLPEQMPYDSEILKSYEVGFKSTLFDGRLQLNGSAFFYDYEDKQAFTFAGLTSTLVNRDSDVRGLEFEIAAAPADGLHAAFGVSLLDTNVDDVPLPSGREADQEMAQAPELTLNGLIRKVWQLGDASLSAQVDGYYVSRQYFNTMNHPTTEADSYRIYNGRIGYASGDGHWELALFVRNLTDEEAVTYSIDVSAFGYTVLTYAPPRWFGGQVRYRWD